MKNADEKLAELWKSARTAATSDVSAEETLTPGIATRIASRWATSDERTLHMILLERVTAICLVPALATWSILNWSTPAQAEPNLMELLLAAQLVVENPPPF